MDHDRGHHHSEHNHSHDPLVGAQRQSLRFNHAWFKNGERLSLFQRATFALLSFLLLGFGMYILRGLIEAIRDQDMYGSALAFFLAIGLPLIAMAVFGLRNVLRFPKKKDDK